MSFLLAILGTFITRSGVISSVHSFTKSNVGPIFAGFLGFSVLRSEEHTSELQSRFDLVCRLLLEKKKLSGSLDIANPDVADRISDDRRRIVLVFYDTYEPLSFAPVGDPWNFLH